MLDIGGRRHAAMPVDQGVATSCRGERRAFCEPRRRFKPPRCAAGSSAASPGFRSPAWPAEQIALRLHAALGAQDLELLLGLDAFGGGDHAEARAEAHHGADDGDAIVLLAQFADEGAVDLDLVEGEAAQIAERRIAGAEIVHADAHAELAQLMQHVEHGRIVLQQDGFGDFQLEPRGREAATGRAPTSPTAPMSVRNCAAED